MFISSVQCIIPSECAVTMEMMMTWIKKFIQLLDLVPISRSNEAFFHCRNQIDVTLRCRNHVKIAELIRIDILVCFFSLKNTWVIFCLFFQSRLLLATLKYQQTSDLCTSCFASCLAFCPQSDYENVRTFFYCLGLSHLLEVDSI